MELFAHNSPLIYKHLGSLSEPTIQLYNRQLAELPAILCR